MPVRVGVLAALAFALHHCVESFAIRPSAVAIHGVVAAVDAGHLPQPYSRIFCSSCARYPAPGGQSVAAVHKGVNEDALDALLLGHFQQRIQMCLVRVHTAIGYQTEEVSCRPPSRARFIAVTSAG